jgi:MFS family permease
MQPQAMFVTAVFFSFLGPLMLGALLDSYGPRVCSIISLSFVALGSLLFGLSDRPHLPMFIPALSMIAFGGPGAQSAIIHLSNLFPKYKATATALITGSLNLSFVVFFAFDQLWHFMGFDYRSLFIGYAALVCFNILISLFLWPDKPYSFVEQILPSTDDLEALAAAAEEAELVSDVISY